MSTSNSTSTTPSALRTSHGSSRTSTSNYDSTNNTNLTSSSRSTTSTTQDRASSLPLLDNSLLFKVVIPANQDVKSESFPRPTQDIIADAKAEKARKDHLSALGTKISMGEEQYMKLHFELVWQVKFIDIMMASSHPELLLTKMKYLIWGIN